MNTRLGRTVILVNDYDEAFEFYRKNFFCKKIHDQTDPNGQRYLHIAFSEDTDTGIWFLKASSDSGLNPVGNQTAGQPMLVIYVREIDSLFGHLVNNGVNIIEEPVSAGGSKFFHCLDLYGNRIVVVELGVQ